MSAKDIQKMFSPVIHHEDGAYWAEIPAMPGCFTVADTLDELGRPVPPHEPRHTENHGNNQKIGVC